MLLDAVLSDFVDNSLVDIVIAIKLHENNHLLQCHITVCGDKTKNLK